MMNRFGMLFFKQLKLFFERICIAYRECMRNKTAAAVFEFSNGGFIDGEIMIQIGV